MKLGFVVTFVEDVSASIRFYQNAFDLDVRMEHKEEDQLLYAEMETEGAILGLASHQIGQMNLGGQYKKLNELEKPAGQEIVFVCDQVEEGYRKAIQAGAKSIQAPNQKPWGQTVAHIRDPDGVLIELCTPMNP